MGKNTMSEAIRPALEQMRHAQDAFSASNAAKAAEYSAVFHRDLPYLDDGLADHLLDIVTPDDAPAVRPVILEVHGGGYCSCSKLTNAPHAAYLASCGWNVVNINYRLQPEVGFREEIQDLCAALDWMNANREKWHLDMRNLMVTGDSAGGHLILLLTGVLADPELRKYYGVENTAAVIRAAAATCPAGSLKTFQAASDQVSVLCRTVLGFHQTEADWDVCSIDRLILRGTYPEVMILSTPTDDLLYEHTRGLHRSFEEATVTHVYREFVSETEGSPLGHVFNVLEPERPESIAANQAILEYFKKHIFQRANSRRL